MEQDIKNFDRNIEQMMNEQQVAPPFGMWNRISAELDAMPVAAAAPATSLIPKRAAVGFIAGALLIGAAFTGYMVNSFTKPQSNLQAVVTQQPLNVTPVSTIAVKEEAPQPVKQQPVAVATKKYKPAVALAPVLTEEAKGVQETSSPVIVTQTLPVNINTDVPTPAQPVGANLSTENPTYYFPPVDMNIPEKSNKEKASRVVAKADVDNDDDGDKRTKLISSNENRVKFHPKKRKPFTYGHIIHSKK